MKSVLISIAVLFMLSPVISCTQSPVELKYYPLTKDTSVITRDGVSFDSTVSTDGNGSFKMTAGKTTTFRLIETGDIPVENARIVYRAKIRTQDVKGKAYLEMVCQFEGFGEFFSRALRAPLSGTNEWSTMNTPFFLKKGQDPTNIKLNVVIEGSGTVWIDDIHLIKAPLQ